MTSPRLIPYILLSLAIATTVACIDIAKHWAGEPPTGAKRFIMIEKDNIYYCPLQSGTVTYNAANGSEAMDKCRELSRPPN